MKAGSRVAIAMSPSNGIYVRARRSGFTPQRVGLQDMRSALGVVTGKLQLIAVLAQGKVAGGIFGYP